MKNIEQIRERVEWARKVEHGSTAIMREFLDEFREKKSLIRDDRNLSSVGQEGRVKTLQGQYEPKAIKLALEIKTEYQNALAEAKSAAEKLMFADVPAVSDRDRKIFQIKSDNLAAQIQFATNPAAAVAALEDLVNVADQPALAAETKEKFMQLSQQAVSLAGDQNEALTMRKKLGQLYDRLASNAMTEDGRAAAEIVRQADAMRDAEIFIPLVKDAFQEVSKITRHYISDPQAYFDRSGGEE